MYDHGKMLEKENTTLKIKYITNILLPSNHCGTL